MPWNSMQPLDEVGQHVRHWKTHRNAFVQHFGPSSSVVIERKMLVYCPDSNSEELHWTTVLYKVPDLPIRDRTAYGDVLVVPTEKNGQMTME